jgi:hypothetical protein
MVVEQNPLQNISTLREVRLVLKEGEPVFQK